MATIIPNEEVQKLDKSQLTKDCWRFIVHKRKNREYYAGRMYVYDGVEWFDKSELIQYIRAIHFVDRMEAQRILARLPRMPERVVPEY